jgi:hypothetical protein
MPNRQTVGLRHLVEYLQEKKAYKLAWEIMSRELKEPGYPTDIPNETRKDLQARYENNPKDVVNARSYAQVLEQEGDHPRAAEVIKNTARIPDSPRWFIEKAA